MYNRALAESLTRPLQPIHPTFGFRCCLTPLCWEFRSRRDHVQESAGCRSFTGHRLAISGIVCQPGIRNKCRCRPKRTMPGTRSYPIRCWHAAGGPAAAHQGTPIGSPMTSPFCRHLKQITISLELPDLYQEYKQKLMHWKKISDLTPRHYRHSDFIIYKHS